MAFVLTKPVEPREALKVVDRKHLHLLTSTPSEKTEDLRSANARLRALINIGLELASERNSDRLLRRVCVAARDLFGATYVTLGIVDRNHRTLQHFVTEGTDAAHWITIGDGVPGILRPVVTDRRSVRGDNADGDPARLQLPPLHPDIHAYLAAPIESPTDVYGWICLVGNEGRTFTEDDEALVMALSGQVGRVYENGYLYTVAQTERDRAQRCLDTTETILLALDLEGRITLINRYGCVLLGWTAEELLGRDFIETCVPARIRSLTRQKLRQVHGGDDSPVENAVVTRTGEEKMIEWRTSFLRDEEGRIVSTLSSGTDITERKRADDQLRLQSAALNAAANAMVITDRAGLIEWVNPAFSEMTGYSAAEALGKSSQDLVRSGQHEQAFYTHRRDAILSGLVWRGELVNRRKDGTLYTEEQTITPVRDSQGEIVHFIGVKENITQRKRAEEDSHQRVRLSTLGAAVGLALADSESLTGALQRCAEALVTHLEVVCARIWTLSERKGVLELRASADIYTHLNGPYGTVPFGQFTIERIARDRRPYLTNSVIGDPAVSDQEWARREGLAAFAGHPLIVDDHVVGVMALIAKHPLSDATLSTLASVADHLALGIERHRSAEALRATEERTRFALENADVGVWDLDCTTSALRWSATNEAHYGLQPGTFGGTFEALLERVHPDDRTSLLDTVGKAKKAGTEFSTRHRALWPDGTVRWLSGVGRFLLDEQGAPVRGLGISLDITERLMLEEQFQQAQKMEAVGRLAGGVAHDFNNLLTSILGYCELLLADVGQGDPRGADIMEIQKAGTHAAGLTRQLLAFSQKQLIEPTLLDLNAIVADMRGLLGRLLGEDVTIVVGPPVPLASVKADRGQVEQVIMNLAVNARDAMPTGGTLTIETAHVELDELYAATHVEVTPGPYVMLSVTDTGTGMTPRVQARLFEPFFTTKEPGRGTGLGMATVYGIVTRAGGSVSVYSEVGKGTAFKVYFPRVDATEVAAKVPTSPDVRPRVGMQTVLVVEDAEGLRALAKRLLERQGYTVLVAANAEEALPLFERSPSIDLLLTDVVMPGASGPELTKQLIERRPALKVIYMSGYAGDSIVEHGIIDPGIAFIHKPFTADTLVGKVRAVLDR